MKDYTHLLVFRLSDQRFALPVDAVERVIRAVAVTPLPNAPAIVLGVINVAGRILPVMNLRSRLGWPVKDVAPGDQFLIVNTGRRTVALVSDEAQDVITHPSSAIVESDQILAGLEHIRGLIKLEDGLVLIQDLETLLSPQEERALLEAMNSEAPDGS